MTAELRALLVEDSATDAELILRRLRTGGRIVRSSRVESGPDLERELESSRWDVVLCDYHLPGFSSAEVVETVRRKDPDLPVLIVSGAIGEEAAADLMRGGARDLILKDRLERLLPAVDREIADCVARRELRRGRERYTRLVETTVDAIVAIDEEGCIVEWNESATRMFGWTKEEALGRPAHGLLAPEREWEAAKAGRAAFRGAGSGKFVGKLVEVSALRRDGSEFPVEMNVSPVRGPDGWQATAVIRDISARRREEGRKDALRRLREEAATATDLPGLCRALHRILGGLLDVDGLEITLADPSAGEPGPAVAGPGEPPWRWIGVPLRIGSRSFGTLVCRFRDPEGSGPAGAEEIFAVAGDIAAGAMDRIRSHGELLRREAEYHRVVDHISDGLLVDDPAGRIVFANDRLLEIFGLSREELATLTIEDLVAPSGREAVRRGHETRVRAEAVPELIQFEGVRKDGRRIQVEARVTTIREAGRIVGTQSLVRDVTEHRELEAELRHSQKMEAVGRLAGGVAHDFNNLLTAIGGHAELLRRNFAEGDPRRARVEEIMKTVGRAAALTRQLLAFSRRQPQEPQTLNLSDVVGGVLNLLRRLLGVDVQLDADLDPAPAPVLADPGQMEQVLMNLAVNARDAMPDGGAITILTRNVEVTGEIARAHPGAGPGLHVAVIVEDTGTGMDEETRAKIFEPFFTTKPRDHGTGLGLSTVHGIVHQAGGFITVRTAPGEGSTFTVYLPAATPGVRPTAEGSAPGPAGGTETILLVEDDATVRAVAELMLSGAGYRVVTARGAVEAFSAARAHPGSIDLLLTDVMMPDRSGPELARDWTALRPGARVLFMSGHPGNGVGRPGEASLRHRLLEKPFSQESLLVAVRQVLDDPR